MSDIEAAWEHLGNVTTVTPWKKPAGASDEQVLFMATCMETWIVSDRATLKEHFGAKLQESALVPLNKELERRSRDQVQDTLMHATRRCANAYTKGKRSFEILGKVTAAVLEKHLPSFVRVRRILTKKL